MTNRKHLSRLVGTTLLIGLFSLSLVSGCSDDEPNGPGADTTAPTVLSTNPINGATGMALINATFSESMNASTIGQTSFTIKGPGNTPVAGAVTYDAEQNRALFVPNVPLALATVYTATVTNTAKDDAGNSLANDYVWSFTTFDATINQLPVVLATTIDYAVVAGTTITSTGATFIAGGIGLSPGTVVTGFPPGIISGTSHIGDAGSVQAKLDLTAAFNSAAERLSGAVTIAGNIGGMTLPSGLYKSTSGLEISSGDLTLDAKGNTSAIWIFQIASTLVTGADSRVILTGGANASNIYWQVGSSATLGTASDFAGIIMADQSITMNTGASLEGRAFARSGAVTLKENSIVTPTAAPSPRTAEAIRKVSR